MSRWILISAALLPAACGSAPTPVVVPGRPVAPAFAAPPASASAAPRARLEQPEAPAELRETASLLAGVCQLGTLPPPEADQPDFGTPRFGCVCCAPFDGCAPGQSPEVSEYDAMGEAEQLFWPNWTLSGSFTRPGADQRVMAMYGCESHAAGYGGLLLLTRLGDRFVMERYYSGIYPSECRAFRKDDGRDLLVCRHEDGHMGHAVESVVQWELPDGDVDFDSVVPLLDVDDDAPSGCFSELHAPISSRRLRKLEYVQVAGHTELAIEVDWRKGQVTAEYLKRCEEADRVIAAGEKLDPARAPVNLLRSRKEQHRFRFDGTRFVRR